MPLRTCLLGFALVAPSAVQASVQAPDLIPRIAPSVQIPPPPCAQERSVSSNPGRGFLLCIVERDGWPHLAVFDQNNVSDQTIIALTHSMIFAILASKDLEPLWPQVMEFVGSDGELLRSMLRRRAEQILLRGFTNPSPDSEIEHFLGGSVLASMQAADLLTEAGDADKALSVLREKRKELESSRLRTESSQFGWTSILIRIARIEMGMFNYANAEATYIQVVKNKKVAGKYRINGSINFAAMLAEIGQAKRSLALLEDTEVRYLKDNSGEAVSGSERQFAWIRACNLERMGDKNGAKRAMSVVLEAPASLRYGGGGIAPTESIAIRMAYCMEDEVALTALMRNNQGWLLDPAWYVTQEAGLLGSESRRQTDSKVRKRFVMEGYLPRVRQMPETLVLAMNHWRTRADLPRPVPTVGVERTGS